MGISYFNEKPMSNITQWFIKCQNIVKITISINYKKVNIFAFI